MMAPGRELDALVAEKVLGWRIFRVGYWSTDDETPEQRHYKNELDAEEFESVGWYAWTGSKVVEWDVWDRPFTFSTSIADAWIVFSIFPSRYIWYDGATDLWHCHVDTRRCVMDDCRYRARSEDYSGAQAICLAALKAVGVNQSACIVASSLK